MVVAVVVVVLGVVLGVLVVVVTAVAVLVAVAGGANAKNTERPAVPNMQSLTAKQIQAALLVYLSFDDDNGEHGCASGSCLTKP